jgi:RNA polymerase sigma-54 factor
MTKQNLDIRTSQSLALTPRLQQAIQLLQMSVQELSAYVASQVEENPLLQQEGSDILLTDLTAPIIEHPTREDDDEYMDAHIEDLYINGVSEPGDDDFTYFEGKSEKSLTDILLEQLYISFTDPQECLIGEYMIHSLNDYGFLEMDCSEIAETLGVDIADVERVLSRMQTFEPLGIFARNIKECFRIQLDHSGELTESMVNLLENLELLGTQPLPKVAKSINLTVDLCQNLLEKLRHLNRKPLDCESQVSIETVIPEVIMVRQIDGSWGVELNPEALPKVYVDSDYYHDLKHNLVRSSEKSYISERYSHAQWLINSINQRCETLLKVTREIIKHQQGFFEKGYSAFRPLTLKQVADVLDIHESSVSRITTSKFLETPYGILSLKFFFSAAISPIYEDSSLSARRIQEAMRELLKAESAQSPYSDDDIVTLLNNQGMAVARRTIAKYRKVLKIPSSVERRRAYELNPTMRFC